MVSIYNIGRLMNVFTGMDSSLKDISIMKTFTFLLIGTGSKFFPLRTAQFLERLQFSMCKPWLPTLHCPVVSNPIKNTK